MHGVAAAIRKRLCCAAVEPVPRDERLHLLGRRLSLIRLHHGLALGVPQVQQRTQALLLGGVELQLLGRTLHHALAVLLPVGIGHGMTAVVHAHHRAAHPAHATIAAARVALAGRMPAGHQRHRHQRCTGHRRQTPHHGA